MKYVRGFFFRGSTLSLVVFGILFGTISMNLSSNLSVAQAPQSPTPLRIQINTPTPLPLIQQQEASPTMTPTATEQQIVVLEVKDIVEGGVNVRSDPDPESNQLGIIQSGDQYPVTGRYFRWLRFRYETSPTGQGWVYDELVDIIGDQSLIPDLSEEPEATTDATVVGATLTWEAITLTPGGLETATASARILAEPIEAGEGDIDMDGGFSNLPTFTPPPRVALISTPIPEVTIDPVSTPLDFSRGIPPIVPIAVLGVLGILGLATSVVRR